jgi:hypothetical protein
VRTSGKAGVCPASVADILSSLIESATIYPGEDDVAEAEMVAKVSDLAAFATNDNAALGGGVSSSAVLVAGTRTERRHISPAIDI